MGAVPAVHQQHRFLRRLFDATGIPQLAYTAEFGNGISASVALEDAYPYRTSGVANMSLSGTTR